MIRNILQYIVSTCIALISVVVERSVGSTAVDHFILEQGLIIIAALIAVSVTSVIFTISCLEKIEQKLEKPNFFDASRKEALSCIREQGTMSIFLYAALAASPDYWWNSPGLPWYTAIPGIITRACIFQVIYASYDFVRASITASMRHR